MQAFQAGRSRANGDDGRECTVGVGVAACIDLPDVAGDEGLVGRATRSRTLEEAFSLFV